jgi:S-adenosylmethionine:tRNA ribosyltransferase-isomerase
LIYLKNCWQNFRLNTEMKRLMVIDRKKQTIEHKTFKDVIDYFDDGDVLIWIILKFSPRCTEIKKTGARIVFFT